MVLREKYLHNPCGTLSIPYWKAKRMQIPLGMCIVHDCDFSPEKYEGYEDTRYFRIFNLLSDDTTISSADICFSTVEVTELETLAGVINACYEDLHMFCKQLVSYTKQPVYAPDLWIWACDRMSGEKMGCGLADYDAEIGELSLEWIQVLPQFRRRGVGEAIVREILRRRPAGARFATVSGKVDDKNCPEALYRKCGFLGDDVWHVLRK